MNKLAAWYVNVAFAELYHANNNREAKPTLILPAQLLQPRLWASPALMHTYSPAQEFNGMAWPASHPLRRSVNSRPPSRPPALNPVIYGWTWRPAPQITLVLVGIKVETKMKLLPRNSYQS